ncbi:unnamed protein product [Adineta ricciae]|uniref:Uncharacterized protein n=1 Tax=Adineta ricciae TaxID=249248 RepID=A0A815JY28_ADIRI|nr:unnamed protein product [Adineta ricciae]CAF1388202.1 unnamed protein product [Adineta ricciae]
MATYSASPSYGAPPSVVYVAPAYGGDASQVHDWLIWSIINIFVGWGGGLLPLIFSIICRSHKNSNDASGARTFSILALVFNILATIGGVIGWIYLIIFFAVIASIHT